MSVCDKCMVIVTPATIKFCQSGCSKRMKFANLCEKHPEEFHVYGGICKRCIPSAIVRSITAESLNELEEPLDREVLMVISNSEITYDRYKVASKGESECVHLFGANDKMVGYGMNNDNNCNDELIYKIKENRYDTIFHV